MFKEFKEFAMRGNVIDMAVGIIVGGAFGKIVTSMVNDVLMPPIGLLLNQVDFSNLFINLSPRTYYTLSEAKAAGEATINYGLFLNTILDFIIVSFVIFILIRQLNRINRIKRQSDFTSNTPAIRECPHCFSNISIKATRCAHCTSDLNDLKTV